MMNRITALTNALNPPAPLPVVSMEAQGPDGVARVETEIEIYGTMRNMDELTKAADWEVQEQWGLYIPQTAKNAGSGGPRVRSTQDSNGSTTYVLTTKVKLPKGNQECEETSTADMFTMFKMLAESGLRKKRYFFPIPNTDMKFEVDVFYGPAGTPLPEVKIDLELTDQGLKDGFDPRSVELPFEMSDIRIIAPGRKNDEDLAYVRKLFSEKYDIPNQYRGNAVSLEDLHASMEEFAPPGCICGKCGWGDSCPGQAAKRQQEADRDAKASTEGLRKYQDKLVDLSNMATGIAGCLTYNETQVESRIKSQCHELSTAISAGFKRLNDDDGDHEFR